MKTDRRHTILLADDDPLIISLYQTKFKKLGYDLIIATDGDEALQKAKEAKADIILLDRMLPNIDGLEVLENLRQMPETKNLPVLILTNRDPGSDELEKAKKLGALDYLIKERIDLGVLASRIKEILNQRA